MGGGLLIACLLLSACKQHGGDGNGDVVRYVSTEGTNGTGRDAACYVTTKYAEGFKVKNIEGGVRLVDIQNPQEPKSTVYQFALIPRGTKPVGLPEGYTPIETPIQSCMCMTSLQLSNFIALDACDFVTGITSTRHLFNEQMNERIKSGKTAKIGIEGNFDSEVIMSMNPDVIFISPFKRGGYEQMKEVHLPLVPQ